MDTRQRLSRLAECCPECIERRHEFSDYDGSMVWWLAKNDPDNEITIGYLKPHYDKSEQWYTEYRGIFDTLTDALISAVEAVLDADKEKQDE